MRTLRPLFALAAIAALALITSCTVMNTEPVEPESQARPVFLTPPTLDRTPPAGITTVVVPNVVERVEPRIQWAPGALELSSQITVTEVPRPNYKQPVEVDLRARNGSHAIIAGPLDFEIDADGGGGVSAAVSSFGFNFDSFDLGDSGAIPPDPHGAVGPDHLVNVLNSRFAIYQKDGTEDTSGSLFSLFSSIASTGTFDPRVIYDTIDDRFVVITLEYYNDGSTTQSKILVAVSDDSDPNGTWYLQEINAKTVISSEWRWADYPTLAADEDNIYITANMFGVTSGGFANSHIWMLDKGAGTGGFYDGGVASVKTLLPPVSNQNYTLQPADMVAAHPDPTVGTFFLSYNGQSDGTNQLVKVMTLTDPTGVPSLTVEYVPFGTPDQGGQVPNAPQSGAQAINVDARKLMDAVWRDQNLYAVTTMRRFAEATVHWWQFDTTTLFGTTLVDQGDVNAEDIAEDSATFYPSIAVDSIGRVGIGFAGSAPTTFAGSYFTYRFPGDPPGTVQPTQTVRAGNAAYYRSDGSRNRWGDYSGIDHDPVTDCFWMYNEYAKGVNFWGTVWGEFCLDFECGNDTLEPGESCEPPGEPAGAPDVCRTDCNFCGDGGLQTTFEQCDDANNLDGDGCDRNCNFEYCGNGILQVGEQCDPPGAAPGQPDQCRFDCTFCGDGNVDSGGGNLVANGGFDLGNLGGWTVLVSGGGDFFVDQPGTTTPLSGRDTRPKLGSGTFYAVSDSQSAGVHGLQQTFLVPADASSVVLKFDLFANNYNFGGTWIHAAGLDWDVLPDANQHARVDLLNPGFPDFDTSPEAVIDTYYIGADAGANPNPFSSYNIDITSDVEPGQSYVLRFAEVSNQGELNLGVNLVKLEVTTTAEGCDDGNNVGGDTCSSACELCTTAPFTQTVRALDHDTFFWDIPADTVYAIGDLADVASYTPTSTGSMTFQTSTDLTATPAAGEGLYILFRADCPGASWSSGGPGECCTRPLP